LHSAIVTLSACRRRGNYARVCRSRFAASPVFGILPSFAHGRPSCRLNQLPSTAYTWPNCTSGCSPVPFIVGTYLTGTGIRLDGVDLAPSVHFDLPFGTFSTVELAHLFSIFDSSRVHQQAEKSTSWDEAPPGLYFTVINPRLIENQHKNRIGIFQREDAALDLFIEDMHIDHYYLSARRAPPGLGTLAFALCAITAHLAGIGRITLVAADGRGGYASYVDAQVWPKFGFDAPLFPGETANIEYCALGRLYQRARHHGCGRDVVEQARYTTAYDV